MRTRDGKTYYVMTDPTAFREGVGRLLAEVQRIKARRRLRRRRKQLFETYGVHFDPKLRDEVVARVEQLQAAVLHRLRDAEARAGDETPQARSPTSTISYPLDLTTQMLEYSAATRSLRQIAAVGVFPPACPADLGANRWPRPLQRGAGGRVRSSTSPNRIPTRAGFDYPARSARAAGDPRGLAYEPQPVRLDARRAARSPPTTRGGASRSHPSASC